MLHVRKAWAIDWKHIVEKRKVLSIAIESSVWTSLECIPMYAAWWPPLSNSIISCCRGATVSGLTAWSFQDDIGWLFPISIGSGWCPKDETVRWKWVIQLNAGENWFTSKNRRSACTQLYRAKMWRWNGAASLVTNNETITSTHKHIERSMWMIETIWSFPSPNLGIRMRIPVEYHVRTHRYS